MNGEYIKKLSQEEFHAAALPYYKNIEGKGLNLVKISELLQGRVSVLNEIPDHIDFFEDTFETLVGESAQFKEVVEKAKAYAKFNAPVLIIGEDGTEKEMLAQCIQNASVCSNDAFVSISCDNLLAEKLTAVIFGSGGQNEKGLVELVEGGILFLDKLSHLDSRAQFLLYQLVRNEVLIRGDDLRPLPAHVRVIASDTQELISMVESGLFREDLFHVLNTLPLRVEPLRDRPEDIQAWVNHFISQFEKKHQRYIHITSGANKLLQETCWAGNLPELCSFCERLVILSPHRSVNESVIYSLMDKNPPLIYKKSTARKMTSAEQDEKSAQLAALLKKYHGKRSLVAQELNISTTTLWRYLKKYGIYENKKSFKI
jgi:DNA-binding NtrC family response regulator